MKQLLTERQKAVLEYVSRCIREQGYQPTMREIGDHFGIRSTHGVHRHLDALERKGYLRREGGRSRAIRLVDHPLIRTLELPIVGRVAAGEPNLALEDIEGTISLDRQWVNGDDCFLLRVKGDSMIGAGIRPGDLVVVRPQPMVENGQIAVVLIEGEATVKRFYREQGRVRLEPENPDMEPTILSCRTESVSVIGKVIGLYREM
ncbi:MAG: transcriptional repressor LexA [Gemmatimonadota bacterium]|nr:MAG: transcriptional repressor LexA [Gemmatimonadota bacterium]